MGWMRSIGKAVNLLNESGALQKLSSPVGQAQPAVPPDVLNEMRKPGGQPLENDPMPFASLPAPVGQDRFAGPAQPAVPNDVLNQMRGLTPMEQVRVPTSAPVAAPLGNMAMPMNNPFQQQAQAQAPAFLRPDQAMQFLQQPTQTPFLRPEDTQGIGSLFMRMMR